MTKTKEELAYKKWKAMIKIVRMLNQTFGAKKGQK